ncbi:MAG: hypothetical protein RLZZ546_1449 [Bacteroidota bacterium]|jgi:peptide chain release factor
MEKTILQVTGGRGPHECTWVVAQVIREILKEVKNQNIDAKILHSTQGEFNGTIESAFIEIYGKSVKNFTNSWIGTIQWIGKSPYRKFHKRKNWFIGVFEIDLTEIPVFCEKQVSYQAMRSAGAGGQNVNKVSTCIRAIHLPTNLQVQVMDTRSQLQNKILALARLKIKFEQQNHEYLKKMEVDHWKNQMQIERGKAIRTYEGEKFILK